MGGWLLRVLFERGWGRLWGFSCFWEGGRGRLFWLLERREERGEW